MAADQAALLRRWEQIEYVIEAEEVTYLQLKQNWFLDDYAYLRSLPVDEHLWCKHKDVLWQMLEPFSEPSNSSELRALWKRVASELEKCLECVRAYHCAKAFFEAEFEDQAVKPMLDHLRKLDHERIVSSVSRILAAEDPVPEDSVTTLLEVLLFPALLNDDLVRSLVGCTVKTKFLSLFRKQAHPMVYELLFYANRDVQNIGKELASSYGHFGSTEELSSIQPVLDKYIQLVQEGSIESHPSVTLESLWSGLHDFLGFVQPPAFEGILEAEPALLAVIIKNVEAASPVLVYALNCLKLSLEVLGCKVWDRAAVKPSELYHRLSSEFLLVGQDIVHNALLALFGPLTRALICGASEEHRTIRAEVLRLLFHRVHNDTGFGAALREKALMIATEIVSDSYSGDAPPWDCANIWGPSMIAVARTDERANHLLRSIFVTDATVLAKLHAKRNNYDSFPSPGFQYPHAAASTGEWHCVPLIWQEMLIAMSEEPAFLNTFILATSMLSPFGESSHEDILEEALSWGGSANEQCSNVVHCEASLDELIRLFKEYANAFAGRCMAIELPWELSMTPSLLMLAVDCNLNIRQFAAMGIRALSGTDDIGYGLGIVCNSAALPATVLASLTKLATCLPAQLSSCIEYLLSISCSLIRSLQQRGSDNYVRQFSDSLWPVLKLVLSSDEMQINTSVRTLVDLIADTCSSDTSCSIRACSEGGSSWLRELVEEKLNPRPLAAVSTPMIQESFIVLSDSDDDSSVAVVSGKGDENENAAPRGFSEDGKDRELAQGTLRKRAPPDVLTSDRSKRPMPGRVIKLDYWYKLVLALDFFSLEEPSTGLSKVPPSFNDAEEYVRVFTPLLLEEFKAELQRLHDDLNMLPQAAMRLVSANRESIFTLGIFNSQQEKKAFLKNDLLLLSEQPIYEAAEGIHLLAKVEGRQSRHPEAILLKMFLPNDNVRLSEAARLLTINSSWYATKLISSTPYYRACQAIASVGSLSLMNRILRPDLYTATVDEGHFTKALWYKLKEEYNSSQLEAIQAAVEDGRSGISLVQGPPGTGKTSTIIGIISAWAECYMRRSARKPRVLVCAQSNGAVDELVSRIRKTGLYDFEGLPYKPRMVRFGNLRMVHPDSRSVFIDNLVDRVLSIEQGKEDPQSPELVQEQLNEVMDRMHDLNRHCYKLKQKEATEAFEATATLQLLSRLHEQHNDLLSKLLEPGNDQGQERFRNRDSWSSTKMKILREADIIFTTLTSCGSDLYSVCLSDMKNMAFNIAIIDEAAQALEPTTLFPLQLLDKEHGRCVLIGDPKQLPATVLSASASRMSLECSMFERFQQNGYPVTMLNVQYRMHPEIRRFPSLHYYNNQLVDGDSVLKAARFAEFHRQRIFGPYMFFDVPDGRENKTNQSLSNLEEVEAAVELFRSFKQRYRVQSGQVGIITPYKQQLKLFQERFASSLGKYTVSEVEFGTVDGFQGRELDIVMLSTVRVSQSSLSNSGKAADIGFVADVRRMNVALTRARYSLWIFGNAATLESNPDWAALLRDARDRGLVTTLRKPYAMNFQV